MLDRPLNPTAPAFARGDALAAQWATSTGVVAYPDAVAAMEARAAAVAVGEARELVWLLEHPPLYTAGVSAKPADLLEPGRFEVFETGRGGQYTYHGPGQRVAYVMLDLTQRRRDVRAFVAALEAWVIAALGDLGVRAELREGRIGVWVEHGGREEKIAAVGVKLRRWVSFHGVAVNVSPDLGHFGGIVPCGISEHGVTSLQRLGSPHGMADLDAALKARFRQVFGPVEDAASPV